MQPSDDPHNTNAQSVLRRAWQRYLFLLPKPMLSLKPASSLIVAIAGVFLFFFFIDFENAPCKKITE